MTSHTRINRLRFALKEGDACCALRLMDEIRTENYPKTLLRPFLASCHPGLDERFLDLDLVPSSLFIAPLLPEALAGLPLDARRLSLTHGCDLREFVTDYLNDVLRGERPLYNDLPALDIHTYYELVKRTPARSKWLKRHTALECLAFEVVSGIQSEVTALRRWRSSHHDALLEQPWIWIQPSKDLLRSDLQRVVSAPHGVQMVSNFEEAFVLIQQATDNLLNGGATYLVWNSSDVPPTGWISALRGLQQQRTSPFQQIGETRYGLQEIRPIRFSKERSLLAINAAWFARRNPRQVLSFLRHWLTGPISNGSHSMGIYPPARLPLIRPSICEGVLVLAVTDQQLQEFGKANLKRRVTQRALEGGFHTGILLELESNTGFTIRHQLETLASANFQGTQIVSFIGAEDLVAPDSWDYLARYLSIKDDVLLCSDEELQWSQDPVRIGQRQFAGQPTPYRVITRGHLPGLVAVKLALIISFDIKERYLSLHGFIKDLGLQWMARNRKIEMVPQALLRRRLTSNPTVLNISTCNQRNPFSPAQLRELDDITKRRASFWLHSEGSIFRGARAGSYDLLRRPLPEDKVSVIIPFRNQADMTRVCVLSLLELETTTPYEIILIDNGSTEPEAIELSSSLKSSALAHDINLIAIRDDSPFNFAAINNRARFHCSGNFLLFLNNDIRFESQDPLCHLLNSFALKCTGAVSSRLMYEDGTIQHSGLVAAPFQSHDILSTGKGFCPGSETDTFAALTLSEQWSAATAACLLIRSEEFDCIGGFDERFSVAYNDIDLCWRLLQRSLAVIVTPTPTIIHSESQSRGEDIAGEKRKRLAKESGALRDLYPKYFQYGDPLYNRFLDPFSQHFEPVDMPIQPIGKSRSGILYSWTNLDFKPGDRPFVIYAHYDPAGEVRPDIFAQLQAYRCHSNVAFVSASPQLINNTIAMKKLRDITDIVLVRHNEGYDFGSWQAGILFCNKYVQEVPRLILANDSCYGPFYDLSQLFDRLSASNADVIGLTDSTTLQHHLQSYFIAYNKRVLSSPVFWSFWNQIQIWPSKVDLVRVYEVGWSDILVKAGFQLEALYFAGEHGNVTHTHWRQLLVDYEFPFIKTELLRLNPILQDINGWYEIAYKLNPRIAPMVLEHLARSSLVNKSSPL